MDAPKRIPCTHLPCCFFPVAIWTAELNVPASNFLGVKVRTFTTTDAMVPAPITHLEVELKLRRRAALNAAATKLQNQKLP